MQRNANQKDHSSPEHGEFVAPWDHSTFVNMMVECSYGLPLSEKRFPETITLDGTNGKSSIGTISNALMSETLADPEKKERARRGVVNLEKKLVFQSTIVGEQETVRPTVKITIRRIMVGEQLYTKSGQIPSRYTPMVLRTYHLQVPTSSH